MANAPVTELGTPSAFGNSMLPGVIPWSVFIGDELEHVPDLQWPASVSTYAKMRNDAQLQGLYQGAMLPIRQRNWGLDPNGAKPEVVAALADDLGLPVKDAAPAPRRRIKNRFSFDKHLTDALRACVYGFYFFEQVGVIGDDGKWHLRKLAPRPPHTISEINVSAKGSLNYVRQATGPLSPPIPVEVMVAYVWDMEGANWIGRSMLRGCYGPWLIKDRVLRVGAINIERAGAGVPIIEAPPNATRSQMSELNRLAQTYRAGAAAGGAVPNGASLTLHGIKGNQPDAAGYIRLMNEEMARAFVMMFMNLGQTASGFGSQALGGDLIDYFKLAQDAIAQWFTDVFQEHVIEDWGDWNYGEDEQMPMLTTLDDVVPPPEPSATQPDTTPQGPLDAMVAALDSGEVVMDAHLAHEIRTAARRSSPGPRVASRARRRDRAAGAADGSSPASLSLPSRPLRRQPYDHEVRAAVDYAQIESDYTTERDKLVKAYKSLQAQQRAELHDAIVAADGDLAKLAVLSAEPVGADAIATALHGAAEKGVTQHVNEANRQGSKITRPALTGVKDALTARAEATAALLSRGYSEAAARKAMQLTAESIDSAEVATQVVGYLSGLVGTYLEQQLGGAINSALNSGRKAAMRQADPSRIYSSELLDEGTCENCVAVDGTEYSSVDDAEGDYPTGGYMDCLGAERCRGTLVAVYGEDA